MKEDFEFEKFYNEVTEFEEIKNVEKGTKRVTILFLVEVTVTFLVICILFRGNYYAIVEALSNISILGVGLVCLIIFLVANYYALTMCKFFIVNKIVTKKFDVKLSITDFLTTDGSKEYGDSIILPILEKRIIKKYFKEISGVYNPKSFFVRPHGFSASSLMKNSLPKEFSMQEDDALKCYANASPEDIGVVKTYFFGNGVTKNNLNFAMLNTTHYDVNWGEVESFTGMVSVTRLPKSFDMTIYVLQNKKILRSMGKILPEESKVLMGYQEFDENFVTYSSDVINAKMMLANGVMEAILKFYKETGVECEMILKDDILCIRFFSGKIFDIVKTRWYHCKIDKEKLYNYCKIIESMSDMPDKILRALNEM